MAVVEDGRWSEGLNDLVAVVGTRGGDDRGVVADEGGVIALAVLRAQARRIDAVSAQLDSARAALAVRA